jgi:pyridoxal phosphate enzyme (YggS family)
MSVVENLARVRDEIAAASQRAGRNPGQVTLVAVSKTFPAEAVHEAWQAGVRHFGENRVQEAAGKIPKVTRVLGSPEIQWHLVGHLQRRKARDAAGLFDVIQSVDTVRLAETLDRAAREQGKKLAVLLQVNIANDPTKSGFDASARDEFLQDVGKIGALEHLQVRGLMTIGPPVPNAEQARPFFQALLRLRDELAAQFPVMPLRELSMGMTDDFQVAIEEGATIVRIGRAIFGQRT